MKSFTNNRNKKFRLIGFLLMCLVCLAILADILINTGIFVSNKETVKQYPIKGVDVSSYQGKVNWKRFEEQGIQFAFIKATEGSSTVDKYFPDNWNNAKHTKLRIGAYHFFSYDSAGETQAENFIKTVPKEKYELPPVIDVEFYGENEKNPPQRQEVMKELQTMVDMLSKHYKKRVILYASQKSYTMYIKGNFKDCDLWISNYYSKPLLFELRDWKFWQYTNRGRLEGHSGKQNSLDLNVFNGSAKEFKKL